MRPGLRRSTGWAVTGLALVLVWFALNAPSQISALTPSSFVRIPLEALLFVAVVLVLPARARRVTAALVGVVLGLIAVTRILDMGFFEALGRPFDAVIDWRYLGSGVSLLGDSVGRPLAVVLLLAAAVLALGILVLLPLSVLRLARIASRHRAVSIRTLIGFGTVWAPDSTGFVGLA
ncbi:MAG: hypothetical protein ABI873_10490, partial [Marmoricola sp.]